MTLGEEFIVTAIPVTQLSPPPACVSATVHATGGFAFDPGSLISVTVLPPDTTTESTRLGYEVANI